MKIVLDPTGIEVDAWLADYLRGTVTFALWHHELRVERVSVQLDRAADACGDAYVRCALRALVPGRGPVVSGATGPDACQAIRTAADLLEVALHPLAARTPSIPDRLAA